MRKSLNWIVIAMALLGTGTRAAAPAEPGSISVEPTAVEPSLKSSARAFVEAVGKALAAREFTLLEEAGHARFVAELKLTRVDVGTTAAKVPVAGPSAQAGGDPSQVGGSVSFSLPTAKTRTVPLHQTLLEVFIRKRGQQEVLWHGSAMTVRASDTGNGSDGSVATDLAEAIFRTYPAPSEGVISVP